MKTLIIFIVINVTLEPFKGATERINSKIVNNFNNEKENFSRENWSEVLVKTPNGRIKGQVIDVDDQKLSYFNAIRYAKPPTGKRRFKRPEPVGNWTGVYDATGDRPVCYQIQVDPKQAGNSTESEDCLFLNIWTPDLNPNALQAVMFFICGGYWLEGGATQIYTELYQGKYLASEGIVFVSINYRLGNLGFLYDGTEEAPGNVGLFDQLLALKWVQQNIKYFGGDPNKVTIFGESSGSWSVGLHLISPLSKNLFKRAILQSGGPYFFIGNSLNNSNTMENSRKLAYRNYCFSSNWVKCLRKIEAKKLMTPLISLGTASLLLSLPTLVINDFIPDGIISAMRNGKFSTDKDLIAGLLDGEGSIYAKLLLFPDTDKLTNTAIIKIRIMLAIIIVQFKLGLKNVPTANQIYNEYFGDLTETQLRNKDLLRMRFTDIISDCALVCPLYLQIRDYKRFSKKSSVRFYRLTHRAKTPFNSECSQKWMRACHAEDLPFVFGYPLSLPELYSENDYQVSLMFKYFWTNFAKTGNPFSEEPPENLKINGFEEWPEKKWTEFKPNKTIKALNLSPQQLHYDINPWKKCDIFWSKYFLNN